MKKKTTKKKTFCLLFVFYFCLAKQKSCFPPEKGYFCLSCSVSLCFSLDFFTPPFSHTHTHTLSLSLFLSSFLPSLFSFFLSFPSLFFAFLSCLVSLLVLHEKNNLNILNLKVAFFINPSFGGVSYLCAAVMLADKGAVGGGKIVVPIKFTICAGPFLAIL